MDRFDAMTAFVNVAELKGFAPAARRLGHSPSAVTRLIAALEDRLELRLFQRTTRSVTLTDAGARFLERSRRILADLQEAEGAAQAERSEPTGRFVIAAPQLFGRLNVAPVLSRYLAKYPKVTGELTLSDRLVNLVDEGIDVAIRIGVLSDSSLVGRTVGQTRRVLVASPGYLAQKPELKKPAQLAKHDLIQFTALAPGPEWVFHRGDEPTPVAFAPRFITNDAETAIGHALGGGGVTIALAYQVAEAVRRGRLKILLAAFEPPPLPIHLVFPTNRLLSAKVRTFVDLVKTSADWQFVDL
jgi:DNA-binding transcriptional LysR family regulator